MRASSAFILVLSCFAILAPCEHVLAQELCNDPEACNYLPAGDIPEVCVELEWIADHESGLIAGQSTYRMYLHLPAATDFLSAISGSAGDTVRIQTTTSFYQDGIGDAVSTGANSALFSFFPELEYDSWVTIGHAPEDGTAATPISTIASPDQNWVVEFEAGQDIIIDDLYGGLWYILNDGNSQGLAGDDQRVLIAQLTTDGDISAFISGQFFPDFGTGPGGSANGDIDNRFNSPLDGNCPFNENADCFYAQAGLDCSGICDGVVDECGVCAGIGAAFQCGCANIPDGHCDCDGNQLDALGICGGSCAEDLNGDGLCDATAGCTYAGASNFEPAALQDDGSCTFETQENDCPFDSNDDGIISIVDLLDFLVAFGYSCD